MPRGLENLGNTCYINAVVQALASTSSIVELVRECEPLFVKQAEDFDSARAGSPTRSGSWCRRWRRAGSRSARAS